jgi:hypothetical protein
MVVCSLFRGNFSKIADVAIQEFQGFPESYSERSHRCLSDDSLITRGNQVFQ